MPTLPPLEIPAWPPADAAVAAALRELFASGDWGRYEGAAGQRLTETLRARWGVAHAYPCASGTVAVELALRGLKVGPGDEVILAGYDFPGNFRAIEAVGAQPVLVDLEPGGWTLDPAALEEAWSPQVKCVLASHLHGTLADMGAITRWAASRGAAVLEDACQVPGAVVAGKPAGAWGDASVLSFGGSKLLTAGRGGAVLTNRDDVFQRLRIAGERGNLIYPLSELQAAVLAPQFADLDARNQRRLAAVAQLRGLLADDPLTSARLLPPFAVRDGDFPAFYKTAWRLRESLPPTDEGAAQAHRQRLVCAAQAAGIPLDAGFRGFARRSSRRCRVVGDLPHCRAAAQATVLMHHPILLADPAVIAELAQRLQAVLRESRE